MGTAGTSVAIFSLGGTIATAHDPETGGVVPALSAHDLVAAVPALTDTGIDLRVHDFRRLPSAALTIDDVTALYAAIRKSLAARVDGVVVTQGTDTIEEVAYALDLLHDGDAPIVVTGAMRNPTLPGADGPANLYASVLAAASAELRGMGCVVVLNDEVHAARYVRKGHTTSPAAFMSPWYGPVGDVVEGSVRRTGLAPRRIHVEYDPTRARPMTVALYTVSLGDDGRLLELLDGHCDGLVIAALGAGHVSPPMVPILQKLAERIPVVLSSRIGEGPVLTHTYSFPGSEHDLLSKGLINAGDLGPHKSRLLLQLLLSMGKDRVTVAETLSAASS